MNVSSYSSIASPRDRERLARLPRRKRDGTDTASKSLPAIALPLALLKLTVVATSYAAESVTVKFIGVVPLLPSVALAFAMLTRFVIDNGHDPRFVEHKGIARVAEVDVELPGGLGDAVAIDGDRDRLTRLTGVELVNYPSGQARLDVASS